MYKAERMHAIIVEDDFLSVEVLSEYLEMLGIRYHVIPNGIDILGVMEKFLKVNIIFLDLELVKLNGYSVLETIRSDPRWDEIPIVAYTSHTDQKSQARKAGFHSFLGKPLDSNVLLIQLQQILNNEPVWD